MTDRCKNITLAKTSFRPVIIHALQEVLVSEVLSWDAVKETSQASDQLRTVKRKRGRKGKTGPQREKQATFLAASVRKSSLQEVDCITILKRILEIFHIAAKFANKDFLRCTLSGGT